MSFFPNFLQELKEEDVEKDDNYTGEILTLEVEKLTKVELNSKCGEVLFVDSDHLILICTLCSHPFKNWVLFESHIRDLHFEPKFEFHSVYETIEESDPEKSNDELTVPDLDNIKATESDVDDEENSLETDTSDAEFTTEGSQGSESLKLKDTASDIPNIKRTRNRSNVIRKFRCPKCDCSYSHIRSLRKHIRIAHGQKFVPPTRKDRCRYCRAVFENRELLKAHQEIEHQGDAKYACPHCDRLFRTHTGRQVHISSHTGERPYKCPHCPSDFNVSSNLKKHIDSHLNIRPYACKFCDKTFVQSNERNVHQRRHTGEKPYQCEECGISFFTRTLLARHSKRHGDVRDFKCDQCPKAFYDAATLKGHRLVHASERPFKCAICDKSFARRKGLKQHAYIHSEVKQFVCNTCGKEFAQQSGLRAHQKTH